MVIYGGFTNEDWKWREPRPPLALFVYACGLWIHFDQRDATGPLQGAGIAIQGNVMKGIGSFRENMGNLNL